MNQSALSVVIVIPTKSPKNNQKKTHQNASTTAPNQKMKLNAPQLHSSPKNQKPNHQLATTKETAHKITNAQTITVHQCLNAQKAMTVSLSLHKKKNQKLNHQLVITKETAHKITNAQIITVHRFLNAQKAMNVPLSPHKRKKLHATLKIHANPTPAAQTIHPTVNHAQNQ